MKRTEQEQKVMDLITEAYAGILDLNGGLQANQAELAQAIHTLQMFVMMSVLHRSAPDEWSNWYTS